jgi:succinoglycan biosynthesis protein ExoM
MNKVTICIPSYKRPALLRKLILSIAGCNIDRSLINELNIIVVDNDAEMTAASTVGELKEKFRDLVKIYYYCFPEKGLSNVRNELLRRAFEVNPDFIVFVDDDEYVTPDWLNELTSTIMRNDGDMSIGPVISEFETVVPVYISYWFQRRFYKDNENIKYAATNNLIIKTESLLKHNIWFDNRFNLTGGEDAFFRNQMIRQGAKIFWSEKAVVCEIVPSDRANIKWLTRRYYNASNKFAFILKIEKNSPKILKKILISLLYIFLGFFALLLTPLPVKKRYWGLLKIAEGFGGISGFLSIRYNEYK